MARIPFPQGVSGSDKLPRNRRALLNCFFDGQGNVLSRPGIDSITTTSRVARGQFVWGGSTYIIASQDLLKVSNLETGAFSVVGSIPGSDPVRVAKGFNHAVIVSASGTIRTIDAADTVADISGNTNFVACRDVTHINGRFVYIPTNGDPAFYSDVGAAGTVQADSFFDAEELPDKNNGVFNLANTLMIAGTDSIQPFANTGTTSRAFQPIQRSRILNGYIGGLLEYNGTFLFIGREKDQDFGVYSVAQGQAPKISNEYIDSILATYTVDELAEATTGRIKWKGYDLATFALRRHSFGFLGGFWFLLDTVREGVSRPWAGGYIAQNKGKYYSAFEDKFGVFSNSPTDYGERITRIIDTSLEQEDGDAISCQCIELGISQGYNAAVGSVALQMTRDGVLYGPPIYRKLGALGEYTKRLRWNPPGGLGSYDGFMGIRFYTTEAVDFSASHISAVLR